MDFTESIREWVSIDNKIKKYQDEVKKVLLYFQSRR